MPVKAIYLSHQKLAVVYYLPPVEVERRLEDYAVHMAVGLVRAAEGGVRAEGDVHFFT